MTNRRRVNDNNNISQLLRDSFSVSQQPTHLGTSFPIFHGMQPCVVSGVGFIELEHKFITCILIMEPSTSSPLQTKIEGGTIIIMRGISAGNIKYVLWGTHTPPTPRSIVSLTRSLHFILVCHYSKKDHQQPIFSLKSKYLK